MASAQRSASIRVGLRSWALDAAPDRPRARRLGRRRQVAGVPTNHVQPIAADAAASEAAQDDGGVTGLSAEGLADLAGAGQVVVSQRVAAAVPPGGVVFTDAGEVELKGSAQPVRLLAARRSPR
jgi:class 3 adenylate cyclase